MVIEKTEQTFTCILKCLHKGNINHDYGSYKKLWDHEQTQKHKDQETMLREAGILEKVKLGMICNDTVEIPDEKSGKRSRVRSAKAVLKKIMKSSSKTVEPEEIELLPPLSSAGTVFCCII